MRLQRFVFCSSLLLLIAVLFAGSLLLLFNDSKSGLRVKLTGESIEHTAQVAIQGTMTEDPEQNRARQNLSLDQTIELRVLARRKMVQDYCKRNKRSDTLIGRDLSHHIVFHSKKIIYCFIPKVACTQWLQQLVVLDDSIKNVAYKDIHEDVKFNTLDRYSKQEAKQLLEKYYTFLFVREPLERILSAYKNKFVEENISYRRRYGTQIIKRFRPNATKQALRTGSDLTFPEFTNYLVNIPSSDYDVHWLSYDSLCSPCSIDHDFIGRYEDLAEEAPYLLKRAGIDDRISFPPFRKSNTTGALLQYYSQIPKPRISQLAKRYQSDYEMFGYSLPGVLEALLNSTNPY